MQQAKAAASNEMANRLARRLNNSLPSLMQVAYLAAEGQSDQNTKTLGQELSLDLRRLSAMLYESLVFARQRFQLELTLLHELVFRNEFADTVAMVLSLK